jgi:hypothetical protein
MYFFVMYNLSGIQKGIQAGHAAVEYSRYAADRVGGYEQYAEFADDHKTFILLDGGGSQDMPMRAFELRSLNVKTASFYEPDLNNSLSAIAFILPEEVYGIDLADLPDPGVEGDEDYARRYAIKSYISQFRLASN